MRALPSKTIEPHAPVADAEVERELIERIAREDRRALQELYLAYHRRLSRFLLRITRRYDVAEEVINDTFWVVWRKAPGFRGDSLVSTWILGIAYRRALKAVKRQAPILELAKRDPRLDPAQLPIEPGSDAELSDWLDAALARLAPEQRLAVELTYFLGHSCEEIAHIAGCPVNTVKTRLFHARQKLRQYLGSQF